MALIPSIESVQDFCSQSDLDAFRSFRCIGLAAKLSPQESLPEVCEGLMKSMSARIHNGAARKYFKMKTQQIHCDELTRALQLQVQDVQLLCHIHSEHE